MGCALSKSPSSRGRAGSEPILAHPGPTLRGLQAHLVAVPPEWSLDDGNGLPVESGQGWDSGPGGRQGVWQRREGGARTLSPRCLLAQPHLKLRISGQDCGLMSGSWKLGSAAGTTSIPRLPALASASLRARPPWSSFLPAFPFFLSPPHST